MVKSDALAALASPGHVLTAGRVKGTHYRALYDAGEPAYAYVLIDDETPTESAALEAFAKIGAPLFPAYFAWIRNGASCAWAVDQNGLDPIGDAAAIPHPSRTGVALVLDTDGNSQLRAPLIEERPTTRAVAFVFERVHNLLRDGDGLQPHEALDELLKLIFLALHSERHSLTVPARRQLTYPDGHTELEPHASHAQRVRAAFSAALLAQDIFEREPSDFHALKLTSSTLSPVVTALLEVPFASLPVDIKNTALNIFLAGAARRGLGIFLTPDPVVEMVVEALHPSAKQRIIDPACGTGSFLLHTLFRWLRAEIGDSSRGELWGSDKNQGILRIAEVNLGPILGARFHRWNGDALIAFDEPKADTPKWFAPGQFDIVMTNPPFGVTVSGELLRRGSFATGRDRDGAYLPRQGSEIVFVERCLDLLRPGGTLAIVVPNSVITNAGYATGRAAIDRKGQLFAVVSLPPETFSLAGTQSATSVLFISRRDARKSLPGGRVLYAPVKNVGHDSTGRPRPGSQLPAVSDALGAYIRGEEHQPPSIFRSISVPTGTELSALGTAIAAAPATAKNVGRIALRDCVQLVRTGKTPPRASYEDKGHFILKVGNLTGAGIDWTPRNRNFVSPAYARKLTQRPAGEEMILEVDDILLTSSAHSVNYIAAKSDIVDYLPEFLRPPITYVGELLLIRADPAKIDPYYLLAFLRSRGAIISLQSMVRGQTAHLMPGDAAELLVPLPSKAQSAEVAHLRQLLTQARDSHREATIRTREIRKLVASMFDVDD